MTDLHAIFDSCLLTLDEPYRSRLQQCWKRAQEAGLGLPQLCGASDEAEWQYQMSWSTTQFYADIELYPKGYAWFCRDRLADDASGSDHMLSEMPEEAWTAFAQAASQK